MLRIRDYAQWALLLSLLVALSACATEGGGGIADDADGSETASSEGGDAAGGTIGIGSKDFTEQIIVAHMYALSLEKAGFEVDTSKLNLGSSEVVYPALKDGEIDVYPEYVGTGLEFLNGGAGEATADVEETLEKFRAAAEPDGVTVLDPSDATDANVFTVTQETADELGVAKVSDLADKAGDLKLGGPPECPERPLCALGLKETYGIEFGEFRPLDAGGPLTVKALDSGEVDVALMFTTLGVFADKDYVQLEDDKGLQPAENITPIVRTEALNDDVEAALTAVSEVLTTDDMIALNKAVDIDGEDPETVAEEFLNEKGVLDG